MANAVSRHLSDLWGSYWYLPFSPLLLLPVLAYLGELRSEHVIVVAVLVGLALWNRTTKSLLIAAAPGVAVGLGYEIVRFLRPFFVTADRVWGCSLRDIELSLFPVGADLTLPEYFLAHNNPALDIFFAVPYTLFWLVAILFGVYLYFRNRAAMQRYLVILALSHAVGFVFWLATPAAPPWYIVMNGCGIDIDALPNAAALHRLDAAFGISYFHDFYSRAPTVFGALPSLHCVFPTSALVAIWRDARWPERSAHLGYVAWMLGASVYLGHHWLVDGLLGILIVLAVFFATRRFLPSAQTDRNGRFHATS